MAKYINSIYVHNIFSSEIVVWLSSYISISSCKDLADNVYQEKPR